MRNLIFLLMAVLAILYYKVSRESDWSSTDAIAPTPNEDIVQAEEVIKETPSILISPDIPEPPPPARPKLSLPARVSKPPSSKEITQEANQSSMPDRPEGTLSFVVEDGLAITQGDIVLGLPPESGATEGFAVEPKLELWPSSTIPYHIQPNLSNPERVETALALFDQTVIQFVPYQGHEEHVLVFEEGTGTCKSYVGHIGGHQPIWLSPGCHVSEVAHEILHALGFVHEQNRTDRDEYIQVLVENIDDRHISNFEKFSEKMMQVSGLQPFDFSSIMLYPPSMFSRGGQDTMQPLSDYDRIEPSPTLSQRDILRINQAYGDR